MYSIRKLNLRHAKFEKLKSIKSSHRSYKSSTVPSPCGCITAITWCSTWSSTRWSSTSLTWPLTWWSSLAPLFWKTSLRWVSLASSCFTRRFPWAIWLRLLQTRIHYKSGQSKQGILQFLSYSASFSFPETYSVSDSSWGLSASPSPPWWNDFAPARTQVVSVELRVVFPLNVRCVLNKC